MSDSHQTTCSFATQKNACLRENDVTCNYSICRPTVASSDNDKVTGEDAVTDGVTTAQTVNEQVGEKVVPIFSRPATIITIDTETCTHEVIK